MRIRLDVAYDGTEFHGWAAQPGLRTVESTLAAALTTVLRLDEEVRLTCAGRTDAGVHARGQVVHCDLPSAVEDPARLVRWLNGVLPADLRVRRVVAAAPGFDARFSALSRRYAYRVCDASSALDPLTRAQVLAWRRPLDVARLNAASAHLTGEHDFAAFCKQREGATTVRTLLELSWARDDSGLVVAAVRADAFCHSMVRALVGCLLAVGEGRRPDDWPLSVLQTERRDPGVTVAPAHGLTLEEVAYPDDAELEARAIVTRARRA